MKVIQHGLGLMGQMAIKMMLRKGIEVVGAYDGNKELWCRDLGDILGMDKQIGVKVSENIPSLLKNVKADIVTNASVTKLEPLAPEINLFLDAGLNFASISEELAYPWLKYPKLAKELDERAKKNKVTVVGTGVNPGTGMDLVPLTYAGGCWNINKIKVQRVLDGSVYSPTRGAKRFGVSPEAFVKGAKEKTVPLHTGLYESLTMMSDALGWKLDNIYECWEPLVSQRVRETKHFTVQPGTTSGWKQRALGIMDGEVKIELEMYFMIQPDPVEDGVTIGNTTWIDGEPSMCIKETGGSTSRGDLVTSGKLVNIIPAAIAARPGLLSVKDLPPTPPLPDIK
ncbi:MAG: NADP-binding protein [Pseudomonadota bacterium]